MLHLNVLFVHCFCLACFCHSVLHALRIHEGAASCCPCRCWKMVSSLAVLATSLDQMVQRKWMPVAVTVNWHGCSQTGCPFSSRPVAIALPLNVDVCLWTMRRWTALGKLHIRNLVCLSTTLSPCSDKTNCATLVDPDEIERPCRLGERWKRAADAMSRQSWR